MGSVLVIDDAKDFADFIIDCLGKEGLSVSAAYDGTEGVRQAKALLPDLIVLDLMLPGMHGFDVLSRLRQDAALRGIKVLVISAKRYPADEKAARKLGASGYLAKPVGVQDLVSAVRSLIGKV